MQGDQFRPRPSRQALGGRVGIEQLPGLRICEQHRIRRAFKQAAVTLHAFFGLLLQSALVADVFQDMD